MDDVAHEAETVAVDTGGCESDEQVTVDNVPLPRQEERPVDSTDHKPR